MRILNIIINKHNSEDCCTVYNGNCDACNDEMKSDV